LALNFPLIDVVDYAIGPVEIANATHLWSVARGEEAIASLGGNVSAKATKALQLAPVWMRRGDAILRDVRGLHRGTPNTTPNPRPMVVVGFSRAWLRRPEVGVRLAKVCCCVRVSLYFYWFLHFLYVYILLFYYK